jgi:hypothetical protein
MEDCAMLRGLIVILLLSISGAVYGTTSKGGQLPEAATVGCMLGPDSAIYLFQDEQRVFLSGVKRNLVPLALESFKVYRCPGCFGFVGTLDGHRYEGQTSSLFNEETVHWDVFMDLTIDGDETMRLSCTWRH